jgi:hypothetical protein
MGTSSSEAEALNLALQAGSAATLPNAGRRKVTAFLDALCLTPVPTPTDDRCARCAALVVIG